MQHYGQQRASSTARQKALRTARALQTTYWRAASCKLPYDNAVRCSAICKPASGRRDPMPTARDTIVEQHVQRLARAVVSDVACGVASM